MRVYFNFTTLFLPLLITFTAMSEVAIIPKDRFLGCMVSNIYFESIGESDLGKIAVAQVVNQRVKCKQYQYKSINNVCEAITYGAEKSGCAFSWQCDNKLNNIYLDNDVAIRNWNNVVEISQIMLSKSPFVIEELKGATLFHAEGSNPWWINEDDVVFIAQIDHHLFYSEEGRCESGHFGISK